MAIQDSATKAATVGVNRHRLILSPSPLIGCPLGYPLGASALAIGFDCSLTRASRSLAHGRDGAHLQPLDNELLAGATFAFSSRPP
ncbi:hypothetical protein [Bradyrhizobium sp. WD16]|uniref:hypothetical protein n=1 Tax=Bradyrhizobium sp. WD16 TaxID=1521768 RepID=UPI0020A5DEBD|nr:hypothetical protein [Bradyrhizobium sp. WD16]